MLSPLLIVLMTALPCEAANYVVQAESHLIFVPSVLHIQVGDTVTFTESAGQGMGHNVHANDNSFRCALGCDGDGKGGNGNPTTTPWSDTLTFNTAGTIAYQCDAHAGDGMVGAIIVEGPSTTPTNVPITAGFTGTWIDAGATGEAGFGLEVLPGNLLDAEWYTFGPPGQGGQSWIGGVGDITGNQAVITGFQILGSGGVFPPNFNAADVQTLSWGTMTFTFTDCNNGNVTWASTVPGYGSGSLALKRLTQPMGLTCP